MTVIQLNLNIDDTLDSQTIIFVLVSDQTTHRDIFVIALDVHIVVFHLFDLVQGNCQPGDENGSVDSFDMPMICFFL